ncbi:MAG: cupin domain-containing protein [Blastocatellia bacterium]
MTKQKEAHTLAVGDSRQQVAPVAAHHFKVSVSDALARLPGPGGERFAIVFEHGELVVEMYAPRGADPQKPHLRDELYIVVQGTGDFVYCDSRTTFEPGDFLFVPAGALHRFENFSDDLQLWAVFYGPDGRR